MEVIKTSSSTVEIGNIEQSSFQSKANKYNKIAILVDENTRIALPKITPFLKNDSIFTIEIKSGEKQKQLETCQYIWNQLLSFNFNRNDLLINLGGGVITDMGGFAASTFKRGIDFINIPTSLLSMVDASVGGKTGINFNKFKNNIGLFIEPLTVFCDQSLLTTLPQKELISGIGEVLKHALILDQEYWNYCNNNKIENWDWNYIIQQSINLKNNIVLADPFEKSVRKKLNFGHTIGHAIESYFMKENIEILNGEAIAIGMICESHISYQKKHITEKTLTEITELITSIFPYYQLPNSSSQLIEIMKQDKKNTDSSINCTLLNKIGESTIDNNVSLDTIKNALNYYSNLAL